MSISSHEAGRKPRRRSLVLVLLAWVFLSGQALLAAGSMYNYQEADTQTDEATVPWGLVGQGAVKMRLVATQAQPEVIGDVAIFLAVANTLGIVALMCGLLSWSRSKHLSGKLTIAAAVAVILVNSILNLPYA